MPLHQTILSLALAAVFATYSFTKMPHATLAPRYASRVFFFPNSSTAVLLVYSYRVKQHKMVAPSCLCCRVRTPVFMCCCKMIAGNFSDVEKYKAKNRLRWQSSCGGMRACDAAKALYHDALSEFNGTNGYTAMLRCSQTACCFDEVGLEDVAGRGVTIHNSKAAPLMVCST